MLLSVCVRKCKKRDIYKEIMLQGCSCSVAENNNKNNNNSVVCFALLQCLSISCFFLPLLFLFTL
jgi:hypothetical protein